MTPGPSTSEAHDNSTYAEMTSPVVQVIKEMLKPVEDNRTKNRRITTTRCVTSDEFLKEMDEKERKKPKTRKQIVISSESEDNDSGSDEQEEAVDDKCAQCSGSFRDDCNGESWIQ